MRSYKLNIGDVITSVLPASYSCLGLGSCIGLFIHDRLSGQTGGAHIFLPDAEPGPIMYSPYCNVNSAIEELLRQMKMKGSNLSALRAKVTGGANMLGISSNTGERNSQSIIRQLIQNKIFIAAADLGGVYCRTAKYYSDSRLLSVCIPQTNQCNTY